MSVQPGYKGKVVANSITVSEMGNWAMSGMLNAMLESSAFEDTFNKYEYGRGDGGTVTFSGSYDPDASAGEGQDYILAAWKAKTDVADLALYYSDTGYFEPSSGATVKVETVDGPSVDKDGIGTIGFTLRISGGYLEKY